MKSCIPWFVCWPTHSSPGARRRRGIALAALLSLRAATGTCALAADSPDSLVEGCRLFNQGRMPEAIDAYRTAAQQPASAKEALLNIALIYKNLRQYAKAVGIYQQLLSLSPQGVIYANQGEVYYLNNQPAEALRALEQALRLGYTGSGMVCLWAGAACQEQGKNAAARQYLERALSSNPDLVLAHYRLGLDAWDQKDWERTIRHLEAVRDRDPSVTRIYPMLARAYYYQKQYAPALRAFRKVAEVFPQDKETNQFIDRIYAEAGDAFRQEIARRQKERMSAAQPQPVKALVVPQAPQVRVFLTSAPRLRWKCSSAFLLRSAGGRESITGSAGALYETVSVKGRLVVRDEQSRRLLSADTVTIVPESRDATVLLFDVGIGTGQYWASKTDRMYRGSLEITAKQDGCRIINIVNMEEYLSGVVPSEMPGEWPLEALKAQAVAARSEAYAKQGRHKADGYDYCADVHCQSYGGVNTESPSTCAAVDQTRGLVMFSQGKPVDAIYSNSCGGHTQNNIYSSREDIPYLQGKPDSVTGLAFHFPLSPLELEDWLWDPTVPASCNNPVFSRTSNFRWMREYSREELEALIAKQLDIGRLVAVNVRERNSSGHIHSIEVIGSQKRFVVEKELTIRRLLGDLRSSMFNIDVKLDAAGNAERFIFYGGGWGHAVGMCQVGAATMAGQGLSFEEILRFYYTGISIKKIY